MEILQKIRELVKPQYDELKCWVHSWMHIEDVVKNAEKLANLEGINPIPCIIAAYCHDLGRVEEERRKKRGEIPLPHALLSIEPTIKVLQAVGISGIEFDEIVEAVTVHSYRVYEGNNNVAKILQDADKTTGLESRAFLDIINYFGEKDYVNPNEIIKNKDNKEKIRELNDYSLKQIEKGPMLEGVMKGLRIKIEWWDMFHTKHARLLAQEGYEYLIKCKDYLIKKFNL